MNYPFDYMLHLSSIQLPTMLAHESTYHKITHTIYLMLKWKNCLFNHQLSTTYQQPSIQLLVMSDSDMDLE